MRLFIEDVLGVYEHRALVELHDCEKPLKVGAFDLRVALAVVSMVNLFDNVEDRVGLAQLERLVHSGEAPTTTARSRRRQRVSQSARVLGAVTLVDVGQPEGGVHSRRGGGPSGARTGIGKSWSFAFGAYLNEAEELHRLRCSLEWFKQAPKSAPGPVQTGDEDCTDLGSKTAPTSVEDCTDLGAPTESYPISESDDLDERGGLDPFPQVRGDRSKPGEDATDLSRYFAEMRGQLNAPRNAS
jgi:hypothetical protein